MDPVTLSQWQFGITTVYHFFFVPLTIGLSLLVAVFETLYVRTGGEAYKRMTKFWGKLFLINFAMGVVTGIVQEFQFGMNWASYSRFVGDVFGAPLAIEALLAFFLESVFLGVWLFGWDRLSKGLHAVVAWLIALGAIISAFWILTANSFMQSPVGFEVVDGRASMVSFWDLVSNPYLWRQFPHTVLSAFTTGAFFVMGISAYHLLRKSQEEGFKISFRIAAVFGLVSVFLVMLVGHTQTQRMVQAQPMKMAAAEALWMTMDPASFSVFTIADESNRKDIVSFRIPRVLSFLAYNRFDGEVKGMNNLQEEYEQLYGPGDYIPSVFAAYWSFRIMVGAGLAMFLAAAYALWRMVQRKPLHSMRFFWLFVPAMALPYAANTTGWILTEMGRQPWVVYGLMQTKDAVSPTVTPGMVITSLVGFGLVYTLLIFADVYLMQKIAREGMATGEEGAPVDDLPARADNLRKAGV